MAATPAPRASRRGPQVPVVLELTELMPNKPTIVLPDPELLAEAEFIERAELPQRAFDFRTSLTTSLTWSMGGALGWAAIVYLTGYNIGLIAIAIGMLAGVGAARGGRGAQAQKIGAACAALGYFVGQTGAFMALLVSKHGVPEPTQLIYILPVVFLLVLKVTFTSINVVFLGIAVYEGYRIPAPYEPTAEE